MKTKTKLNLGGMVYDYKLNLNAMINFEEETGTSLLNMQEGDPFSLKEMRALLWVGLNECQDISLEEVGGLVDFTNMEAISNRIMEMYGDAVPENDGENEQGKNKKSSTG